MLLTLVFALPAGVLSALKRNSWLDRVVMASVVFGQSMPSYWIGIMLILVVSVQWELLPPFGRGTVAHLVMPSVTLAMFFTARIARLTRSGMISVMKTDYVRTALAKGLSWRRAVFVHALRNSLIPMATSVGSLLGIFLTGSFLIERVFGIQGVGLLAFEAIQARDFPVVMGFLVISSVVLMVGNLVSDLAVAFVDPRVRFE